MVKSKAGWRTIGGKAIYARSRWESNIAAYLQFLKDQGEITDWEHEPETFWFNGIKRGVCSYLPDFRVTDKNGSHFIEVKGWMDPKSKTKLKRMAKYHPDVKIVLVDKPYYEDIKRKLSKIIPGWEF